MSATIRSIVLDVGGEPRAFFGIPANGFGQDELDALIVAATHVRRQLGDVRPPTSPTPIELPEPCG